MTRQEKKKRGIQPKQGELKNADGIEVCMSTMLAERRMCLQRFAKMSSLS